MNALRPLCLLVILGMVLAGCSGSDGDSQGADDTTPAAPPGEPQGTIEGLVLDDEGLPVAGAEVALVELTLTNTTGADGAFVLTAVPVGDHTIAISKLGFESTARKVTVEDGATAQVDFNLVAIAVEEDPFHLTYTYEGKITFGILLVPWSGVFQDLQRAYGTPNPTEDVFAFNWTVYPDDAYPASQLIEVVWTPTTGVTGQHLNPLYLTSGPEVTDQHVIYSGPSDGLPSPIRIEVTDGELESAHKAYPESDFEFGIYPPASEATLDQRFTFHRTDFFVDKHPDGWTYLPEA